MPFTVHEVSAAIKRFKNKSARIDCVFKVNAAYLKKNYIIDENDSLSEYNKIPLGHNRTNSAVYSKIYFKVEICSAH